MASDAHPDERFDIVYEPWSSNVYICSEEDGEEVSFSKIPSREMTDDAIEAIAKQTGWTVDGHVERRLKNPVNKSSFLDLGVGTSFEQLHMFGGDMTPGALLSSIPGVVVVFGLAQSGKSHLMRRMAEVDMKTGRPTTWLSGSEPYEQNLIDMGLVEPTDRPAQGTEDMMDKLMPHIVRTNRDTTFNPVVYIDSMRRKLYDTNNEAAGEGGMSNMFVLQLTELSNICMARGVTLVIALNPMVKDPDKLQALYEKMIASVAAVAFVEHQTVGKVHLRHGRSNDLTLQQVYNMLDEAARPTNAPKKDDSPVVPKSIRSHFNPQDALSPELRRLGRVINAESAAVTKKRD
jgi:hypothetical protein